MQNSEFGIQSESEAGRWIASPAARNKKNLSLRAKRGRLKRESAKTGLPRLLVKSRSDGKK